MAPAGVGNGLTCLLCVPVPHLQVPGLSGWLYFSECPLSNISGDSPTPALCVMFEPVTDQQTMRPPRGIQIATLSCIHGFDLATSGVGFSRYDTGFKITQMVGRDDEPSGPTETQSFAVS